MGCPTEVYLEQNLVFSITTHDPDTGVLTDADDPPAYWIYEEETATAILTGTMSTLDTANTTGFYTELIACTAVNGFEHNKNYTIYIEATVDGDTGGICYNFRALTELTAAIAADAVWDELSTGHVSAGKAGTQLWTDIDAIKVKTDLISTGTAITVVAALSGGELTITRGDTLSAAFTNVGALTDYVSIDFTIKQDKQDADTAAILRIRKNASGLTDGLVRFNGAALVLPMVSTDGSLTIDDEPTGDVTVALAASATASLVPYSGYYYDIQLIKATGVTTLTSGPCSVAADVTRAVV